MRFTLRLNDAGSSQLHPGTPFETCPKITAVNQCSLSMRVTNFQYQRTNMTSNCSAASLLNHFGECAISPFQQAHDEPLLIAEVLMTFQFGR